VSWASLIGWGQVKETAGKVTGDARTETEGAAERPQAGYRTPLAVPGRRPGSSEEVTAKTPTAASYPP
jgi:hypothetical protein